MTTQARHVRWFLAFLVALFVAVVGLFSAAPASGAPAAYTYDTTPYAYDAPADLSTAHASFGAARGSPAGSEVVSWASHVSTGCLGVAANTVGGAWSVDTLSASGSRLVGKDLTRAGQELAKHAGEGAFPVPKGSPSLISRTGQEQLDDIPGHPGTRIEGITKGNFAGGKYYIAPDGRGAAFDSSGVFQYFGVFGP